MLWSFTTQSHDTIHHQEIATNHKHNNDALRKTFFQETYPKWYPEVAED